MLFLESSIDEIVFMSDGFEIHSNVFLGIRRLKRVGITRKLKNDVKSMINRAVKKINMQSDMYTNIYYID